MIEPIPTNIEDWYKSELVKRDQEEKKNEIHGMAQNFGVAFSQDQINKFNQNLQDNRNQSLGKRIIKDVAKGLTIDLPKAVWSAGTDAVVETVKAGEDLIEGVAKLVGTKIGKRKIVEEMFDDEEYIFGLEKWQDYMKFRPTSVTGKMAEDILQFGLGFIGAGKFIKTIKPLEGYLKGKPIRKSMLKGGIADATVFDPQEQRLSTLIEDHTILANPITEFLKADPNDKKAIGRLKAFGEGLGLGAIFEGILVPGVRALRGNKRTQLTEEINVNREMQNQQKNSSELDPSYADALGPKKGGYIIGTTKPTKKQKYFKTKLEKDVESQELIDLNFRKIRSPEDARRVALEVERQFTNVIDDFKKREEFGKKLTDNEEKHFLKIQEKRNQVPGARFGKNDYKLFKQAEKYVPDAMEDIIERPGMLKDMTEQKVAAMGLIIKSSLRKMGDLTADLARKQRLGTDTKIDVFVWEQAQKSHGYIMAHWRKLGAEQARQFHDRHLVNIDILQDARKARDYVDKYIDEVHGDNSLFKTKIQRMKDLFEANLLPGKLVRSIDEMHKAKTVDKVLEIFINGILSGPKTHLVNMIGNSIVLGLRFAEVGVARAISKAFGDDVAVMAGETMAEADGMMSAFSDLMRYYRKSLNEDVVGKYGPNKPVDKPMGYDLTTTKLETGNRKSIGQTQYSLDDKMKHPLGPATNLFGALIRLPGRALMHEDALFKTIGYRMGLHKHAHRKAVQEYQKQSMEGKIITKGEGKTPLIKDAKTKAEIESNYVKYRKAEILDQIDDNKYLEIRELADEQAHIQTFTKKVSHPGMQKFQQFLLRTPYARFAVPFFRTPYNILTFVTERSPMRFMVPKFNQQLAGKFGKTEAYMAMSKLSIGYMTAMWGMDLTLNGKLTGLGNQPKGQLQVRRRMGIQPYSIKIGDKWFVYSRTDPIGLLLGVVADMSEMFLEQEDMGDAEYGPMELFSTTVLALAQSLTNKTYLSGISELVEVINDPDRFGTNYASRLIGALVPFSALQREIKKASTNELKQTAGFLGDARKNTLGFGDNLPTRRDFWGNVIPTKNLALGDNATGLLWDILSPIYATKEVKNPVDEEFLRLGYFPKAPFSRSTRVNGIKIDTYKYTEDYDNLNKTFGNLKLPKYNNKTLYQTLYTLIDGKGYENNFYNTLDDDTKELYIRSIISDYRTATKRIIFSAPQNRKLRHLIKGG